MSQISEKYHKDYKNITFDNPRLQKKREDLADRKKKAAAVLVGALMVGLVYLIFFAPFFDIKSIDITGLNKVKRASIDRIINQYRSERTFFVFSKNNFWVFSKSALISRINKEYYFAKLSVKRKFPASIVIILQEKQPAITWLANNLCYNLDETGTAIEYCDKIKAEMTIRDLLDRERIISDKVLSSDETKKLLNLNFRLQAIVNNKFQIVSYDMDGNILKAKTGQVLEIRFDTSLDVGEQLERLALLLAQKDAPEIVKQSQYIDLRFGEKVYIK